MNMTTSSQNNDPPDAPRVTALALTSLAETPETVEVICGVRVDKRHLANWDKWSRTPVVTLRQAVHLSFGVEPSNAYLGCDPTQPLAERLDLALANIGPGAPLATVADLYAPFSSWFGWQAITVYVRLATFGDWVLANDLPLDANCPRNLPGLPEAPNMAFDRQQKTLLKVVGMLARAVAYKKKSAMRDNRIIVNAVVHAALEASETPDGPLGVKKSTLAEYIRKGLNLLDEKY